MTWLGLFSFLTVCIPVELGSKLILNAKFGVEVYGEELSSGLELSISSFSTWGVCTIDFITCCRFWVMDFLFFFFFSETSIFNEESSSFWGDVFLLFCEVCFTSLLLIKDLMDLVISFISTSSVCIPFSTVETWAWHPMPLLNLMISLPSPSSSSTCMFLSNPQMLVSVSLLIYVFGPFSLNLSSYSLANWAIASSISSFRRSADTSTASCANPNLLAPMFSLLIFSY